MFGRRGFRAMEKVHRRGVKLRNLNALRGCGGRGWPLRKGINLGSIGPSPVPWVSSRDQVSTKRGRTRKKGDLGDRKKSDTLEGRGGKAPLFHIAGIRY